MTSGELSAAVIARLELLEAHRCIADLVHRYAQNIRTGNVSACASLFTTDAAYEVREAALGDQGSGRIRSKLEGSEAILGYLTKAASAGGTVCPMIHNLLIRVNGHEATSSCIMMAVVGESSMSVLGEYQDSYRHDGDWRFTSRIFTMFRGPRG